MYRQTDAIWKRPYATPRRDPRPQSDAPPHRGRGGRVAGGEGFRALGVNAIARRTLALVFRRHIAALKANPETLEMMARETIERNELTSALAAMRETRSLAVMKALTDRFPVPRGVQRRPACAAIRNQ